MSVKKPSTTVKDVKDVKLSGVQEGERREVWPKVGSAGWRGKVGFQICVMMETAVC